MFQMELMSKKKKNFKKYIITYFPMIFPFRNQKILIYFLKNPKKKIKNTKIKEKQSKKKKKKSPKIKTENQSRIKPIQNLKHIQTILKNIHITNQYIKIVLLEMEMEMEKILANLQKIIWTRLIRKNQKKRRKIFLLEMEKFFLTFSILKQKIYQTHQITHQQSLSHHEGN